MTNTMCHDGYCDYEHKESERVDTDAGNGLLATGVVILVAALIIAGVWYGNSIGIYPNVDIVPLM